MATVYIDATQFSAVVCTCDWRGLTGNLVTAWGAGVAHLRICHEDLPCMSRLAGRTRRPMSTTGESFWPAKELCRQWTFPRVDRTTRPPRRPDTATAAPRHGHHRVRVNQTRTGLSRLGRGSADLPGRSNIRETSAPSINWIVRTKGLPQ